MKDRGLYDMWKWLKNKVLYYNIIMIYFYFFYIILKLKLINYF